MIKSEKNFLMNKKEKIVLPYLLGCVILIILLWLFLVWHEQRIKSISFDLDNLSDINDFTFAIDLVSYQRDERPITEDTVKINGWLVKLDEEIKNCTIHIVLKDSKSNQCYLLPTQIVEREDVTQSLFDEYKQYNYNQSGFSVSVPYKKLGNNYSRDYEIMALYILNGKKYFLDSGMTVKTWENQFHEPIKEKDVTMVEGEEYKFSVDAISYKGDQKYNDLKVSGWGIWKGHDSKNIDVAVVLKKEGTHEYYKMPTQKNENCLAEVNQADGIDYTQSGFFMNIMQDDVIDTSKFDYDIYIMYSENNKDYLLSTGSSIKKWRK